VSVASLKRFEEDVREVRTGFECGIGLDGFQDFVEGDRIEFFVRERVN
jgi:translation initiation factor IF-2